MEAADRDNNEQYHEEALARQKKVIIEELLEENFEDLEYSERLIDAMGDWVQDYDFLERSGIFNSDFFKLEIQRLRLKYEFDDDRYVHHN